ncbi:MAG: M48 family metallopeptidase [bacterium]
MNIYGIIILLTLATEYALNLFADFLNLRTLTSELPEEMQGVYDPDAYRKSQEYTRVTTQFEIIASTFMLLVTLVFWFSGGFNLLDQMVRSRKFNLLLTGLVYIGILTLFRALLSIPFAIYNTFVIEERFGFNKTTPAVFLIDLVKGMFLSAVLGGPLLAALLAFFEYAGSYAWFYAWVIVALFLLLLQFIAPTWIMPIFNKFKPLEPGELKDKIMSYARSVGFSLQNVFVIDGSRRTSKSNAFFTGFGKNKRIALYDTLIETQTIPEVVAILAHEIGHYKKNHILQGLILDILQTGMMFFLLSIFIGQRGLYDAFYMMEPSVYAGMLFFGLLFTPIEFILSMFLNILSRKNEYVADRFAVQSVERPETMVDALKKLATHNASNLTPHPFYTFLNDSHPPLLERIRAIREVLSSQ